MTNTVDAHADDIVGHIVATRSSRRFRSSRIRTMSAARVRRVFFAVTGVSALTPDDVVGTDRRKPGTGPGDDPNSGRFRRHTSSGCSRRSQQHRRALTRKTWYSRITTSSTDAVQALRSHRDTLAGRLAENAVQINFSRRPGRRTSGRRLPDDARRPGRPRGRRHRAHRCERTETVEAIRAQADSAATRLGETSDVVARGLIERSAR